MKFPTYSVIILFLLVVIIGCSSGISTKPATLIATDEVRFARTDQRVINEKMPAPIPITPAINWIVCLRGNWLASFNAADNMDVELLFIIREDGTYSASAALNKIRVARWETGVYKFDSDILRLYFKTDGAPDWKTAVYYGNYFVCSGKAFNKVDELPEWATN